MSCSICNNWRKVVNENDRLITKLRKQLEAAQMDTARLDKLDQEAAEHGKVEIHIVRGYQTIREIIDSTEVEGEV